jgi:hypothetical protein
MYPLRGELEIKVYSHKMFESWDNVDTKVISVPIQVFIDGFGVFRNSYRSLVGVYAIPAALSIQDRYHRANILPLTLSPHSSNCDDTIRALQSLSDLDQGVETEINAEKFTLVVPTLCYLGDMSQQDSNTGFRGPRTHKFCRFCTVSKSMQDPRTSSGILDFNMAIHGRYHYQTIEMRREMYQKATNAKLDAYG